MDRQIDRYLIKRPDQEVMKAAARREDSLLKPPGSLGELEQMAVRLAGIYGTTSPKIGKKTMIVMAADNGVTEEGVASAPAAYTAIQTRQILQGVTGVGVLAAQAGAGLHVVDIGIRTDLEADGLIRRKVRYGTGNIAKGPAMTEEEALQAIEIGVQEVRQLVSQETRMIGVGEMGIGNTTTTAAVAHAMFPEVPVSTLTGRGAGLRDEALRTKQAVVEQAVRCNQAVKEDPLGVLWKVGGLDICGMAGCYIGAAQMQIPAVVDGVISMAAAFMADQLVPGVRNYLFASHASAEPAYQYFATALSLKPVLDLKMRLGEGSGCPLMFYLLEAACRVINEMAAFEEAGISDSFLVDNR